MNSLRIIHCFRSPVGGIFRHVRDLIEAQHEQGHEIGIVCDSSTGGEFEDRLFEALSAKLKLGLVRIPMRRAITPGDVVTLWKTYKEIAKLEPDVLHSHGAKGGAYARIIGSALKRSGKPIARLYCPHGGSIHYDSQSLKGKLFFAFERMLERMTDRLVFVSKYEADGYAQKVGQPSCASSIVYNGLGDEEFIPVVPNENAADFLYIGMMRDLKGCDVFIDAIHQLNQGDTPKVTAHFVGDGPDKDRYRQTIGELGLNDIIEVHDPMPAREAFALARTVVVPSRAESMPYVVLEAIAAHKPLIATNVGGIPEIFETELEVLVEPGNVEALAKAMSGAMSTCQDEIATERAKALKARFSVTVMAKDVEQAYQDTLNSLAP